MKKLGDLQLSDSFIHILSNRAKYIRKRIALLQKNVNGLNHPKHN